MYMNEDIRFRVMQHFTPRHLIPYFYIITYIIHWYGIKCLHTSVGTTLNITWCRDHVSLSDKFMDVVLSFDNWQVINIVFRLTTIIHNHIISNTSKYLGVKFIVLISDESPLAFQHNLAACLTACKIGIYNLDIGCLSRAHRVYS